MSCGFDSAFTASRTSPFAANGSNVLRKSGFLRQSTRSVALASSPFLRFFLISRIAFLIFPCACPATLRASTGMASTASASVFFVTFSRVVPVRFAYQSLP